MMPYPSYQLYQAERSPSGAERRQAEIRLGQAAARTSELRGRLAGAEIPIRNPTDQGQAGQDGDAPDRSHHGRHPKTAGRPA